MPQGLIQLAVVVPARNAAATLPSLLRSLPDGLDSVVVVDDASEDDTSETAARLGAQVVRHDTRRGPSAARNTGLAAVRAPMVLFLDADVEVEPGAVELLVKQLTEPGVAAAGPRIVAVAPGAGLVRAHELARAAYDQGMGSRDVPYLPSGAVLMRVDAVRQIGGWDEGLTTSEDCDLSWRLMDAGWEVRYEPGAIVRHGQAVDLRSVVSRRFRYGAGTAALGPAHPDRVAAWTLDRDGSLLVQVRGLLWAVTCPWLPVALLSRRGRRLLLTLLIARHVGDWRRTRPPTTPAQWVVVRSVTDGAYAAGLWWGSLRARSAAALLPRVKQ